MTRAQGSLVASVLFLLFAGSAGWAGPPAPPPAPPPPPPCPEGAEQPWTCAEKHLVDGARKLTVPAELRSRIEDEPEWGAWAMVNFCIDKAGKVAGARVARSSGHRDLDRIALDSVGRWTFRPWLDRGGRSHQVCTSMPVGYWLDPSIMTMNVLEAARVAGKPTVSPPARAARAIRAAKKPVYASMYLCLDQNGAPHKANLMRSTGDKEYDRRVERAVKAWRFRPFGRKVCTVATFPATR